MDNLVGKKYGRLTILSEDSHNPGHFWCLCDCGKVTNAWGYNVMYGHTKSCGCARKEHLKEVRGKSLELDRIFDTNFTVIERDKNKTKNSSGRVGVYKQNNGWCAKICVNGNKIYLGYFSDKESAISARERAEEIYFNPIIKAKERYLAEIVVA